MRTATLPLAALLLAIAVAPALAGNGRGMGNGTGMGNGPGAGPGHGPACGNGPLAAYVATLPRETLDQAEIDQLRFMREEEKMARDLYLELASRWNWRAFSQIARAEQAHMDAVKLVLDRYGIADPVGDRPAGLFSDPDLQALYDRLIASGRGSLVAAMKVGALVEESDLSDLRQALDTADNRDLDAVYQNLAKATRNHLRAFVGQLDRQGVDYQAEVLAQDDVDAIVAAGVETGAVDENGKPLAGVAGCPGRRH